MLCVSGNIYTHTPSSDRRTSFQQKSEYPSIHTESLRDGESERLRWKAREREKVRETEVEIEREGVRVGERGEKRQGEGWRMRERWRERGRDGGGKREREREREWWREREWRERVVEREKGHRESLRVCQCEAQTSGMQHSVYLANKQEDSVASQTHTHIHTHTQPCVHIDLLRVEKRALVEERRDGRAS